MAGVGAWMICPTCGGEGSHCRDLGSFTMSEFNEAFDADQQDDYFAGRYDSGCETCDGSGKIREDDEDALDLHNGRLMRERGYNEAGEPLGYC